MTENLDIGAVPKGFKYLVVCCFVFLFACGGAPNDASSSLSSDDNGQYTGEGLEGGAVSEVDFNSSNEAVIDFGVVADTEEYILSIYAYNEDGGTEAYGVGGAGSLNVQESLITGPLALLSDDLTEDFHEKLRDLEADLDPEGIVSSPSTVLALTAQASTSRTFKVLDSFYGTTSTTLVPASLVYQTSNFNIYIDDRNLGSLDRDDIEELATNFDAVIDEEKQMFGYESDVDGDGRFNVLLTQVVNELGGSSGGIVTGFFYAVDLFSSSQYPQSNETEIFYTFVPDPNGDFGTPISKSFSLSNILPSVLPHEYQHMINFNMHYLRNGGSPEKSFLNESLSHLAEDLYSVNAEGYMTHTGVENPARISGYLASTDDLCIVCGASLYQRGGGYLLLRYLYEQAEKGNLSTASSGRDFVYRLLDTDKIGVDNIVMAVYGGGNVETLFRELMGQFGLAIFLSDTDLSSDSRLSVDGINLRASQNDNRGTVLRGPAVQPISSFPMTDTVAGASISYIQISGEDINSLDGQVAVELSSNASAGAYLIQTGL